MAAAPGAIIASMFARSLTAAVAIGGLAVPARAESFDLRDLDKQAHVAVSYGLTLSVATILRRYEVPRWKAVVIAATATAVIGTAKELLDPPYSWGDQLANAIGSSAAVVVVFTFRL
jgi:VanZ family protein